MTVDSFHEMTSVTVMNSSLCKLSSALLLLSCSVAVFKNISNTDQTYATNMTHQYHSQIKSTIFDFHQIPRICQDSCHKLFINPCEHVEL